MAWGYRRALIDKCGMPDRHFQTPRLLRTASRPLQRGWPVSLQGNCGGFWADWEDAASKQFKQNINRPPRGPHHRFLQPPGVGGFFRNTGASGNTHDFIHGSIRCQNFGCLVGPCQTLASKVGCHITHFACAVLRIRISRKLALASWSCSCFSKLSDGVDAPQKPQIID